jgi:hypothetical protein
MSTKLVSRISIYSICFIAVIAFATLEVTHAQGRGNVPPPGAGLDPSYGQQDDARHQKPRGNERPASADRNSRRGGGGNATASRNNSRANSRASKPKFINLMDSGDRSQFRGYAEEEIGEGWSVDGKYLYFDGSGGGDLITKEVYDNFDLQVEWKVADGANSGIMYRVGLGDSAPYMSGPEYQILDDTDHEDGKNPITSAGSLYGMFPPGETKTVKDVGSWNKTRIIVDGNKITHMLNLKKVLSVEIGSDEWKEALANSKFKDWEKFAKNSEGHIAFQDHGNEVWYRNIRIKRLASSQLTDQHASTPAAGKAGTPRRGSKFDQMRAAGPGDAGQPRRGSKFDQMRAAGPGSAGGGDDKKKGAATPRRGSKFDGMQSAAPGSKKGPGSPGK